MPKKITGVLYDRFIRPFTEFSWFVGCSTISLCLLFGYGLIADAVWYGTRNAVILSSILAPVFSLMIVEAVALFEFRAVDLFNYGSDRRSELRDKWLGKFVVRILLVLGNGVVLFKLLKY